MQRVERKEAIEKNIASGLTAQIETKQVVRKANQDEAIEKLIDHGIDAEDVTILRAAGIHYCNILIMISKKHLTEIEGLSEDKVDKIYEAAQKITGNLKAKHDIIDQAATRAMCGSGPETAAGPKESMGCLDQSTKAFPSTENILYGNIFEKEDVQGGFERLPWVINCAKKSLKTRSMAELSTIIKLSKNLTDETLTEIRQRTAQLKQQLQATSLPIPTSADSLPLGWAEAKDPASGATYYYHHHTRTSQWERPVEVSSSLPRVPPLPPQEEWIEALDETSGGKYYYNTKTHVSQWDPPGLSLRKREHPATHSTRSTPMNKGLGKKRAYAEDDELDPEDSSSDSDASRGVGPLFPSDDRKKMEAMTVQKLKAELRRRGLSVTGVKQDLISRLRK